MDDRGSCRRKVDRVSETWRRAGTQDCPSFRGVAGGAKTAEGGGTREGNTVILVGADAVVAAAVADAAMASLEGGAGDCVGSNAGNSNGAGGAFGDGCGGGGGGDCGSS
ncbi:hypothetical protein Nepgr_027460 [Nepenthes gracilis]|uniref:Uncharacterized protein n=1 Tax=Nepenthes gracilis TaxID=150966 RepID=A0AAD3Y193_NEPGR|nr:hypothetical protein Nepgr_027460 [Nepenthes gracilis]